MCTHTEKTTLSCNDDYCKALQIYISWGKGQKTLSFSLEMEPFDNFCIDEAQRVLDIFCFAVFLLLDMTITEARKTKVMGKTVIFDFSPYCGSTVKQFLFYKVSRKIANNAMFLETLIDKEIV